jgi:hypothetical protein
MIPRRRSGIALIIVLAAMLLMDLLALTMIAVAVQETHMANGLTRSTLSALAADAELLGFKRDWNAARHARGDALVDTVADGWYAVRSPRVRAQGALLLRTLPIRTIAGWFPAALVTDGPRAGGWLDSNQGFCTLRCNAHGPPPTAQLDSSTIAQFPIALLDTIALLADHGISGEIVVAPVERSGVCDDSDETNWGAPNDPASPCWSYFPLITVTTELTVAGAGQGILLVSGTLRFERDAHFRGVIILQRGARLITLPGTRIDGAVRGFAAGPVLLMQSVVSFDPCLVWTALTESHALNELLPTMRDWVPTF